MDFMGDLRGVYRDFYGADKPMPNDEDLMNILMGEQTLELMKQLDADLQRAGAPTLSGTRTSQRIPNVRSLSGAALGVSPNAVVKPPAAGAKTAPAQGEMSVPANAANPAAEAAADAAVEEKIPERPAIEELNDLVGLDNIKQDVVQLTALAKIKKLREDRGMKTAPVSLHLVFSGNPGTGKTTVARLLARLYKEVGVLSQGQLVEVDRSGLVAGYVGQTAVKTQEVIKKAMGGILFVDEAYSLSQKDDAFGQEAIDTILKAMEDNRDDFIVIVAGYTEPMKKFINSNPGLQSRFNKYFEFPDYSAEELQRIFVQQCERYQYTLADDAKEAAFEMITKMEANKGPNFANARSVRNLFETVITRQATRVSNIAEPSEEDLMTILKEDTEGISLPADGEGEKESTDAPNPDAATADLIQSLQALADSVKPEGE